MKISRQWLQYYFDEPLPSMEVIGDMLTFHAFEVEEIEVDSMDVKVLPNRASDCLCHRGIAKELSAILDVSLKHDPLVDPLVEWQGMNASLTVHIENPQKCLRYMGALMKGVTVGPSPTWLREALEEVGQRSINNIVDATNYVMLNIGQPLHAFDTAKLTQKDGVYAIKVRNAYDGEKMTTLSNEVISLHPDTLLITDAHAESVLGVAGVKGGKIAEVTATTKEILIESANFEGTTVRRTAQALKLFTDASLRFQNRPSPELAGYGMRDVCALIAEIAGGEIVSVVDEYPTQTVSAIPVTITLSGINGLLGSNFSADEVISVFRQLSFNVLIEGETFIVTQPFPRTDITIPEDLIEEVGRILGLDRIRGIELPPISKEPDQSRYRGIERMKDELVAQGYTEVSTQSFAKDGDIYLANPLDKTKPALRTTLQQNLEEAQMQATYYAPLILPIHTKPKLFEVGTVFLKEGEHLELRMTERVSAWGEHAGIVDNLSIAKLEEYGKEYVPIQYKLGPYRPFSLYPFIVRDIALWVQEGTGVDAIETLLREKAGVLLVRLTLFDEFKKEGRMSYAFRLVFQSFDRTLTDEEIGMIMEDIYTELKHHNFEIR